MDMKNKIDDYEAEHESNLSRPLGAKNKPVQIPLSDEMTEKVDTMLEVAEKAILALEIAEFTTLENQSDVKNYTIEIAENFKQHHKEVDAEIQKYSNGWDISRLVKIDKDILRIAITELLFIKDTPVKVVADEAVELAKKYNVNLVVRSSLTREEGTIVKEESNVEKMLVNGVAVDKDISRIAIVGLKDQPGIAFNVFSLLARNKISVDIILQSIGRENTKDISFTVSTADLNDALKVIEENKNRLKYEKILHETKVAKVSIVGGGMATNSGVASTMFEALYDEDINIRMISTSEIKISVLVDENDAERAARAIHEKFRLDQAK